jgi:hypothetical protein
MWQRLAACDLIPRLKPLAVPAFGYVVKTCAIRPISLGCSRIGVLLLQSFFTIVAVSVDFDIYRHERTSVTVARAHLDVYLTRSASSDCGNITQKIQRGVFDRRLCHQTS